MQKIFLKVLTSAFTAVMLVPSVASAQYWQATGNDIYNTNSGNVGIATTSPDSPLTVQITQGNTKGLSLYKSDVSSTAAWFKIQNATGAAGVLAPVFFSKSNLTTNAYASGFVFDTNTDSAGQGPTASFMSRTSNTTVANRDLFDFSNYAPFESGGATVMRIKANGNVGIGTTSPQGLLDVSGSNANTTLTTIGTPAIHVTNTNTTANNFESLNLMQTNSVGSPVRSGVISAVNTSHTATSEAGDLTFLTTNAGILAEKLRIQANGNVGMGTTSTTDNLTISTSAANSHPSIHLLGGAAGAVGNTLSSLILGTNESGVNNDGVELRAVRSAYVNPDATDFTLLTARTERIRVTKTGNMGIGTTSPQEKLEVKGNIKLTGNVISDGDICIGTCQ